MTRRNITFLKIVGAGWLAWLAVSLAHDRLTAESRFYSKLDEELWKCRQPGVEKAPLSPRARSRLQAALRSRDPASRWQAAADLARWQDRNSAPQLVAAMQDDAGTGRTCVMAQSLGAIGDSSAVPALLEAMDHPRNLDLRVCATAALAEIDDARAVAPLIAKAKNPKLREDDRVSAVLALGDLARSEAASVLSRIAAGDPDERFRTIANAALRQIELMRESDPVSALAEELNSPAHWIRRSWLIQKLAEHWDSRAADALNRFVRRKDARASDQIQAVALLLHRNAVEEETTRALADSGKKENGWLAKYIQAAETGRRDANTHARSRINKNSIISTLSP